MNETEKRAQYFVNIRNSMNGSVNAMLKMELTEIDETKKSVTLHFPLEQWEMNPSGHTRRHHLYDVGYGHGSGSVQLQRRLVCTYDSDGSQL